MYVYEYVCLCLCDCELYICLYAYDGHEDFVVWRVLSGPGGGGEEVWSRPEKGRRSNYSQA